VVRQLERLISDANATLGFPIESRVKAWPSLEEKLQRKDLGLSALAELQDLVGIRVVLLFARDVDPVLEAIRSG
jgi:ppGpp synthetase/RelA/SpoT-type nucleotidyltranferase